MNELNHVWVIRRGEIPYNRIEGECIWEKKTRNNYSSEYICSEAEAENALKWWLKRYQTYTDPNYEFLGCTEDEAYPADEERLFHRIVGYYIYKDKPGIIYKFYIEYQRKKIQTVEAMAQDYGINIPDLSTSMELFDHITIQNKAKELWENTNNGD